MTIGFSKGRGFRADVLCDGESGDAAVGNDGLGENAGASGNVPCVRYEVRTASLSSIK